MTMTMTGSRILTNKQVNRPKTSLKNQSIVSLSGMILQIQVIIGPK